jgi:transcriptional regulator with XRE-family HTH domain
MEGNQRCRLVNNRTPRSRALGNALREVRLERNIGLRQFAKEIDRDPSLLSRWETGDRSPAPTEVARILGKLGVSGDNFDDIIELAEHTDDSRWLATTLPAQRAQLAALLDLERSARSVTDTAPLLIPGLLQTSGYARAIMSGGDSVPVDEIETRVAIRMGRRMALNRPEPIHLVSLIGEAALRQRMGSREVMADQLGYLLEMAERPNIDMRVVPFDSDWHAGLEGSALLIESATESSVVHLEVRASGLFLHAPADVDDYRHALGTVFEQAANTDDSLTVIAMAKAGWESA